MAVVVVAAVGAAVLVQAAPWRQESSPLSPEKVGRCGRTSRAPDRAGLAEVRRQTLCLLNLERARRGLRRLREVHALDVASRRHARDMAARHYLEHVALDGSTPTDRVVRAGYGPHPRLVGENLAFGDREAGSPASIVGGWMHSPGHRANILRRRFREIGIGVALSRRRAYYATDFGRRG